MSTALVVALTMLIVGVLLAVIVGLTLLQWRVHGPAVKTLVARLRNRSSG